MDKPNDPREEQPITSNGLAELAGTWTLEEFVEFEEAIAALDSTAMAAELDKEFER